MSSEQLADGVNPLDAELAATWDILKGYSGRDTDLGIARRFGGAAAAYSLRDIGAMNGRVVKARRDVDGQGSDPEEDFSANQVQDGTLEKWVNGELESTLPADVATAAAAYSLRKVKGSYGIPVTEVNGTDGFPATLLQSEQSITGTSFTVRHFSNQSPDSSEATAANGVYRVSATKTSAAVFAKAIRIKGLEDGKQYTVKGEFRMVEDTTSGGDSIAQVDISDNTAGTDEDAISTTSTTFVPFFIDAGYNSGGSNNFIDFTVSTGGSETGTITAEFRNVQIIENNNSAVRIRRTSDDEEVVVGFDSDNKVSASSPVTATPSGSTTATDLNGFLNESTENFTATAYADIQASLKEWSSTPTISDTAFSGTNGAGGNSTIPYTLSSQLSISDYTGTKIKVTGTVNTLSGGRLFIKASELNTGGTQYTPPEGVKTIADGATGNFEYIFTSTGINEFQSVVFLTEASTIVDVSSIIIQIIEHGATVHTWYDQAGVNNAVQETAPNQPKIASSGALLANGLFFDGGNSFLQTSTQVLTGTETGANSMYAVVNQIAGDAGYICGSAGSQSGSDFVGQSLYGNNVDSAFVLSNGNNINKPERDNITITQNSTVLVSANYSNNNTNTLNKNANNNGYTNGVSAYDFNAGTKFTIGARDGSTATAVMFNGSMQEIIAYDSDQTNNRFKIESNINNYYGLYNDANDMSEAFRATAGTLTNESKDGFDLAVGTPTAYVGFEFNEKIASGDLVFISFNLDLTGGSGGDATPIMRLTKTTLDGTDSSNFINPSDLSQGFNSFELTSSDNDAKFFAISEGNDNVNISISDFKVSRIARNGFVETWYDQSGNGEDMTQGTAGSQPSIVINGGQVKDYKGNNSIDFVSGSTRVLDKSGTTTAKTCIVVLDEDSSGSSERAILGFSDSTSFMRLDTGNDLEVKAGGLQANYRAVPTDVTALYFWYTNGTDEDKLFANNVEEGDTTSATPPNLPFTRIGARNSDSDPYNSRITEVIAFAEDLSADRTVLQDDVNNNYNIF